LRLHLHETAVEASVAPVLDALAVEAGAAIGALES
jgi:hypothetical protein